MARIRQTVGLLLVVALLARPDSAAAAEHPSAAVVRVRIMNEADVSLPILNEALAEATRIYRTVSVEVVWAGGETEVQSSDFVVKLAKMIGANSAGPRVLGLTPRANHRRSRHAWVFYERIHDRAMALTVSCPVLLGVVIAHEVGHLLLTGESHSEAGLMRKTWDTQQVQRAMWGALRFTPKQAFSIRERLTNAHLPVAD